MSCTRCQKPFEDDEESIFHEKLCLSCIEELAESWEDFHQGVIETITKKYRLISINNAPLNDCNCIGDKKVSWFDFFTKGKNKSYKLYLSGLCRQCSGYVEWKVPEAKFSFHVRNNQVPSTTIKSKRKYTDEDYI